MNNEKFTDHRNRGNNEQNRSIVRGRGSDLLLFITFIIYISITYVPIPTHGSLPKSAPYTTVLKDFVGNSTENKACFTKQLTHCVRNEINMKAESDILLERIR